MNHPEARIALGEKVWSNNRWGEVVGWKDGALVVQFKRERNPSAIQQECGPNEYSQNEYSSRGSSKLQYEIDLFMDNLDSFDSFDSLKPTPDFAWESDPLMAKPYVSFPCSSMAFR